MARIRSIKPEFWTDEKIVELDFADRLLFIGLWNFADDQGYLNLRPKRIKMQVFPGDEYDVLSGLRRLWESSLVALYEGSEGFIVHIIGWEKHQRVSNPARERFQAADLRVLDEWPIDVQSPREPSRVLGKGREGKGKEESRDLALARPDDSPKREDVERLCDHLASRIEGQGVKRPNVGKTWRDAARLLVDNDGYTEAQVHWLIDAAHEDRFWSSNVLSMTSLRKHADKLKIQFAGKTPTLSVVTREDGSVDESTLPPVSAENAWMKLRPQS
ncbi:MAG TPA: hypothetical protein VJL80_06220 [Aeromicrobium sp.]|nr:hypothetical protein [Aeromicrobium sp.]HKY57614.1 hypothetical protein [Aeromicrobium sp.]